MYIAVNNNCKCEKGLGLQQKSLSYVALLFYVFAQVFVWLLYIGNFQLNQLTVLAISFNIFANPL